VCAPCGSGRLKMLRSGGLGLAAIRQNRTFLLCSHPWQETAWRLQCPGDPLGGHSSKGQRSCSGVASWFEWRRAAAPNRHC
jgi:hypothetical protein